MMVQWCSFCLSAEAAGTVEGYLEGELVTLPACQDCADNMFNNYIQEELF